MNYLWKNLNHLIFFCKLAQEEQVSSVPLVNISVLFRRRRGFFTWKVPEKTSELSCYSISSACSTLRVQNSSMTTDIMRNCLHLFFLPHSCLLLSATTPLGLQLTCGGASLLPVPILHFSSQAWLLQYNEE